MRATERCHRARTGLLCGVALLAATGLAARGPERPAELAVAGAICAFLGGLALTARATQRARVIELIIAGREDLHLAELEPARRRLQNPRRRAALASSLQRCLRSAERWDRIPTHFRPVANVRLLLPCRNDVIALERLLCTDTLPRVRGVALCEWLLVDGTTSPLYGNDADALQRELGRIRFMLEAR